ncbi:MAG: LysM peptidoglycan-binding domain-containing protein [Planctomycetota bacterium]
MGQLEKYGLYVLCLVIFLILGVTIWPGDSVRDPGQQREAVKRHETALSGVQQSPSPGGVPASGRGSTVGNGGASLAGLQLSELLESPPRPKPMPDQVPPAGQPQLGQLPPGQASPAAVVPASSRRQGSEAAPPAASAPASSTTYTVRRGDTLSEISSRQLGSVRYMKAIRDLNPALNPNRLKVGAKILLPARSALAGGAASGGSSNSGKKGDAFQRAGAYRSYVIVRGDTLERIARVQLGSTGRVGDIKRLNPEVNPRRLRPGKKLKLPVR